MSIKLSSPLKKTIITQPFGTNYLNFYSLLGLNGHNGLDFRARVGTKVYASHSGTITWAGKDSTGGIGVEILSEKHGEGFKTIYYHLSETFLQKGDTVIEGESIGLSGNTGKYTTGPHLHFGLKKTYNGITEDKHNGFWGAIDPYSYFPKNFDKSRAYHRYGRKRNWIAEFNMRFAPHKNEDRWSKAGRHIHKLSERLKYSLPLSGEKINALIYGGWDLESIINPAMRENWQWYKKDEFLRLKNNA